MPDYDSPTAAAYLAEDTLRKDRRLLAYVCESSLPLRWQFLEHQRQQNIRGILSFVDEGGLAWPSAKNECPVIVCGRPGPRLMPSLDTAIAPMMPQEISTVVVASLVEALRGLEVRELTHRGIRPDNLFYADEKEKKRVVLGEAVTAPAAYNQPVLFEPIESGMADPAGRGQGSQEDDIYALGVTVLTLLFGKLPVQEIGNEAILRGKIQKGSYAYLVGSRALPLRMMELLKGLLADNVEYRWGLDRIEHWLDEHREHGHANAPAVAPHIFTFRKEQYTTARALACAFLEHPQQAFRAIQESRFEAWAARSLTNPDTARAITEEINNARSSPLSPERLVARVAILLDPKAPLRYKSFTSMIDGFGGILAAGFGEDEVRHNFADVVRLHLPQYWMTAQGLREAANRKRLQRLHRIEHFLNRRGLGFGLDRCLYELVPGQRCLSPLVLPHYCVRVSELLPALEAATSDQQKLVEPIDSHLAAFIAARFPGRIDAFLVSLASPTGSAERVLGILGLLASLQDRYGPAKLPGLASWLHRLLPPVIESYHNQAFRKQMEQQVEGVIGKGSLVALYNLIGNPARRRADRRAYALARNRYTRSLAETAKLDRKLKELPLTSLVLGHVFAIRFSILIALISFSLMLSRYI
ncbi:MAG: hypothetical protein J4G10_04440 [Alphaproteobacteria bacterium]|nr:hypothetical protein [Alphaproteobacteria bacterium]